MRHRLAALYGAVLAACSGHPTPTSQPPAEPMDHVNVHTSALAEKLLSGHYGALFYYPQREMTIDRIWSEPGNPEALKGLVKDTGASGKARFLAAEVLFARDVFFIDIVGRPMVARLYGEALAHGYTGLANSWGLLWEHDDVGEVGSRFLVLGEAAVPVLTELLDDATVVDTYEGSEEATVGNRYRFRIADFASYYLSRITGIPVPFHRDPAQRPAEIAQLKHKLRDRRS